MARGRAGGLDRTALGPRAPGHVETRDGVGVAAVVEGRALALDELGDGEHRDEHDHREPGKAVEECRGDVPDASQWLVSPADILPTC